MPYSKGQVISLEVKDLNHRGEGVGKADGFTLFIPGALPDETVTVEVTTVHKKYAEASLQAISKSSAHRIPPPCPYFHRCGGCQLQHLSYEKQLAWKQNLITETLRRISGIETPALRILGMKNPWRYRNKANIHLGLSGNRVSAGFFEKSSHRIIDIADCLVQHPTNVQIINKIRQAVQIFLDNNSEIKDGKLFISEAQIRSSFATGECLVTLISAAGNHNLSLLKKLVKNIYNESEIPLAGIALKQIAKKNTASKTEIGKSHLEEEIAPFRYRISQHSFFQVNPGQARVLYEQAVSLSGRPATAYDLYCGTGNFALYLSRSSEQVIGVDSSGSAIADARINARLNNINNINFINARAEEIPELLLKGAHPKTIFLNPPRAGCSSTLLKAAASAKPERIVYISCNPATLARDLGLLQLSGFTVQKIQPVDMFPHTSHIEMIVLLECR